MTTIRGWANYHRHIVAKEIYSYVDCQIYKALWKWCRRRHPKKGKWWISRRYFHSIGNRNWVFAAENQQGETIQLIRAADTKIIRHTKIRQGANPYDMEWQAYFEEREGERMFEGMSGRKALKKIWSNQKGCCTLCGDGINKTSGWKLHISEGKKKKWCTPAVIERYIPNCKTAPVEMRTHQNFKLLERSTVKVVCSVLRGANLGNEGAYPVPCITLMLKSL